MSVSRDIQQLANWLEGECSKNPYGELGVTITLHAGRISLVKKTIVEKQKVEDRVSMDASSD